MNFLFDIGQEGNIHAADKTAQRANDKAVDALSGSIDLKRRVEVMALANQALFEILKTRIGITEEEVILRMAEIDGRDGSNDGKISSRVVLCHKCGRKVSTAPLRCIFCGDTIKDGHVFEKT
ncbi:MAG: hypothetical protein ABIZ04_15800 [Opitutus sp.]